MTATTTLGAVCSAEETKKTGVGVASVGSSETTDRRSKARSVAYRNGPLAGSSICSELRVYFLLYVYVLTWETARKHSGEIWFTTSRNSSRVGSSSAQHTGHLFTLCLWFCGV